jgi:hypothetical protein
MLVNDAGQRILVCSNGLLSFHMYIHSLRHGLNDFIFLDEIKLDQIATAFQWFQQLWNQSQQDEI